MRQWAWRWLVPCVTSCSGFTVPFPCSCASPPHSWGAIFCIINSNMDVSRGDELQSYMDCRDAGPSSARAELVGHSVSCVIGKWSSNELTWFHLDSYCIISEQVASDPYSYSHCIFQFAYCVLSKSARYSTMATTSSRSRSFFRLEGFEYPCVVGDAGLFSVSSLGETDNQFTQMPSTYCI